MELHDEDPVCTICLEPLTDGDHGRAKLECGHHFHLECIVLAFNEKGAMECPNCRNVGTGNWRLFPNRPRPTPEHNVDGSVNHGSITRRSSTTHHASANLYPNGCARARSSTPGLCSPLNHRYPGNATHAALLAQAFERFILQESNKVQYADRACAICQKDVSEGDRGQATLECKHHFHLDCIGSEFNAKGAMECPNCSKVEKGQCWGFPNAPKQSPELDIDDLDNHGDAYDQSHPGLLQLQSTRISPDATAARSSPRGLASLVDHPHPDSATRAALRAQGLESYILQASNQRLVGLSSTGGLISHYRYPNGSARSSSSTRGLGSLSNHRGRATRAAPRAHAFESNILQASNQVRDAYHVCTICREGVTDGDRGQALLECRHHFHLDCIGSEFNAKGAMECPNCKKVGKGQWRSSFPNHPRPSPELNVDGSVNHGDAYDRTQPGSPQLGSTRFSADAAAANHVTRRSSISDRISAYLNRNSSARARSSPRGFGSVLNHPYPVCTICQEGVADGDRGQAKLECGHHFHLDCIGSEFNAKGAMECPNCRKVGKGQWRCLPNGPLPSPELNDDSSVNYADAYDQTQLEFSPLRSTRFSPDVAAANSSTRDLRSLVNHPHPSSATRVALRAHPFESLIPHGHVNSFDQPLAFDSYAWQSSNQGHVGTSSSEGLVYRYHYPNGSARASSSTEGLGSLVNHAHPDSATHANTLEFDIIQASNQRHVGSSSNQPQDESASQSHGSVGDPSDSQ